MEDLSCVYSFSRLPATVLYVHVIRILLYESMYARTPLLVQPVIFMILVKASLMVSIVAVQLIQIPVSRLTWEESLNVSVILSVLSLIITKLP